MHKARKLKFTQVVFTGDLLRPFAHGSEWESATWKNIRWLQALVAPHLERLGVDHSSLTWDPQLHPKKSTYFDAPALYDRLGLELGMARWTTLASLKSAPEALIDQLAPAVKDAIVIGYEMPDVMLDALTELGVPYIDVVLHAVRFMPDLIFAMRTNHPELHESLSFNTVQEADILSRAADIKAKAAWMPAPVDAAPGSLVIFGQVHGDRSLVATDGGGFCSLESHLQELVELCHAHAHAYFKPHPYDVHESPSVRAIRHIGSVEFTSANAYHLMAQDNIRTIAALNSSCLFEARYFDKEVVRFKHCLYDFDADHGPRGGLPGALLSQTPSWLDAAFWGELLSLEAVPSLAVAQWMPDRLRRTMNADWGYGQIGKVVA